MKNKTKVKLRNARDLKFEDFLRKLCDEEYLGNITEEEGNKAVALYKKNNLN